MILSPADLEALTSRVRPSAQKRQLRHLGIPWLERQDGTLVVFDADVRRERVEREREVRDRLEFDRLRAKFGG